MKLLSVMCILSLAAAAAAGVARADVIPTCAVPWGVTAVSFGDIPVAIGKALHAKIGDVAAPGRPFNSTDVVDGKLPTRREIFAWNLGSRWVIATEAGGRVYHDEIDAFDIVADGKRIKPIAFNAWLPRDVCARAQAALVVP